MTIKEAKEFIKTILDAKVLDLPVSQRIPTEFPVSIEEYILRHPLGTILIVYQGGSYKQKSAPGIVHQDRDMGFWVVPVIRHLEGKMTPEEWIDFVIDSLSGEEIEVERANRKLSAANDEFIDEENGVWKYGITITVPELFIEKGFRP
jgi:hypothetical protein